MLDPYHRLEAGDVADAKTRRRAPTHWLRHSAASHQADAGMDLRFIEKDMRHASLQTTGIYLHAEHDLRHAETVREQSECVLPHSWRQRKAVRRIAEPSNSQYFRVDAETRISTTGKQGIQIEDAVSPNIAAPDRCFISRRLTWDNTVITDTIPDNIPVLTDGATFSKKVTVPFGQMRRVSFSHGVDFNICAVPADPQSLIPVDDRCNLDGIMSGKTAQAGIPAL